LAATFDHDQLWRSWHRVEKAALHEGFNRLQALFQTNTWRTWRTWGVTGGILPWDNGAGWLREQVTRGVDGNPTGPARLDSLAPFIPGTRGAWRPQATRGLTQYLRPAGMPLTVAGQALVEANRPTLAWIAGAPDFTDKTHHFRAGAEVAKQIALVNDARHASRWSLSWSAELDGRTLANGTAAGELAPATNGFAPVTFTIPRELTAERVAGSIRLTCTIGDQRSEDRFAFHAFRSGRGTLPAVDVLDPVGETSALLRDLGCDTTTWDGSRHDRLLVVGRKAFSSGTADPTRLAAFFAAGGRALLLAQDPDCLRQHFGLRVARQLTRRAYPVLADHPALAGLDAEAFRDWAGSSHLVAEHVTDQTDNRTPTYGWRWGSRHTLCSAAIETPHRAGWRPLLSCEFDGAYTPLAEATVGAGVMTVCMLDLEDHVAADPAAERVARAVLTSAATTPITNHQPVTYLGGPDGAALLTAAGIRLVAATSLPTSGLVAIGADAVIADAELDRFLTQGGTALILPRRTTTGPLGVRLQEIALHDGSLSVPTWESCRGIAPGELRRRTAGPVAARMPSAQMANWRKSTAVVARRYFANSIPSCWMPII
jgi:beta-galactosidase